MTHRVIHLINGLGKGGAETMLYQILKFRTDEAPDYRVISLGLSHYYEGRIRDLGIDVVEIDICNHPFRSIRELKKNLNDSDVLCCWMYVSNLLGYIFGRKRSDRLIWCIRHSDLSKEHNSKKTILINKICARLSFKVDLVAYNGYRAMEAHKQSGYKPRKECVLENGLDLSEYYPDTDAGKKFRKKIGINESDKVVLSVSKNHPIKDLPTFINAYSIVSKKRDDTVAVMCGSGVTADNPELLELCDKNGLTVGKDIFLLGFIDNVPETLNGGDIYVLHSAGEAFPNTLIQAMACGIPVVSTDVGDAKQILGDSDYVSAPGDPALLADNIVKILELSASELKQLSHRRRAKVEKDYNILNVVKKYEEYENDNVAY